MNSDQLKQVLRTGNYTLIDTREPMELQQGHVEGALNIPLRTIAMKIGEISEMQRPIILFCRSGMRSGVATGMLKVAGIDEVYNGGSWFDVIQAYELAPIEQKKAGE
jgi:rhodanese-related sulfurtransferase